MYEEFSLKLSNNKILKGCKWIKKGSTKNLVLVTGMAESSYRYDAFATFLNEHGFDVYCIDHFGQGLNINTIEEAGVWPVNGFAIAVQMVYEEVLYVKSVSSNPIYLFGHSMGSFVSQEFIEKHGELVKKAVICGSNGSTIITHIGGLVASTRCLFHNRDTYKDKVMDKLSFGAFNKRVKNPKTPFDWLSTNDESNQKYIDDWRCGYVCSTGFYKEFLKGLNRIHKTSHVKLVPNSLPILLVSGDEDPVGEFGKGVMRKYKQYVKLGKDARIILYPGMRHEIINEIGNDKVWNDILSFYEEEN